MHVDYGNNVLLQKMEVKMWNFSESPSRDLNLFTFYFFYLISQTKAAKVWKVKKVHPTMKHR